MYIYNICVICKYINIITYIPPKKWFEFPYMHHQRWVCLPTGYRILHDGSSCFTVQTQIMILLVVPDTPVPQDR